MPPTQDTKPSQNGGYPIPTFLLPTEPIDLTLAWGSGSAGKSEHKLPAYFVPTQPAADLGSARALSSAGNSEYKVPAFLQSTKSSAKLGSTWEPNYADTQKPVEKSESKFKHPVKGLNSLMKPYALGETPKVEYGSGKSSGSLWGSNLPGPGWRGQGTYWKRNLVDSGVDGYHENPGMALRIAMLVFILFWLFFFAGKGFLWAREKVKAKRRIISF